MKDATCKLEVLRCVLVQRAESCQASQAQPWKHEGSQTLERLCVQLLGQRGTHDGLLITVCGSMNQPGGPVQSWQGAGNTLGSELRWYQPILLQKPFAVNAPMKLSFSHFKTFHVFVFCTHNSKSLTSRGRLLRLKHLVTTGAFALSSSQLPLYFAPSI